MEDDIPNHIPRKSKSLEDAAQDIMEIVRTYVKEGACAGA